jgi:hypothetical protein
MLMRVRMRGDGEQAVVADPRPILRALLRLYDPDEPDGEHTSNRHSPFQEHKHIQRVAILSQCRWNEPEIVGKCASFRQDIR